MLGKIGGLVSAAVILLGSFLPWWSVSELDDSAGGFGWGNDGPVVLLGALAIAALLWLWKRETIIAATAVAGTLVVVALHALATNASRLGDTGGFDIEVKPGIGLILVVLGTLAAAGFCVFGLLTGGKGDGAVLKQAFGQAFAQPTTPGYSLAPQQGYGQTPAPGYVAPVAQQPVAQPVVEQPAQPVAQPAEQPAAGVAAGWYPDPHGQAPLRYWDGTTWTEHTHSGS